MEQSSSHVVYLTARDLPEQIADYIHRAPPGTARVVLVEPGFQPVLDNPVRLRALSRLAAQQGMDLGVVSRHSATVEAAAQAHISTFGSVGWAERQTPRRVVAPASAALTDPAALVPASLQAGAQSSVPPRTWRPPYLPRHVHRPPRAGAAHAPGLPWPMEFLALLLIVGGMGYVLVTGLRWLAPSAVVSVFPSPEPIDTAITITADPLADMVNQVSLEIPARRVDTTVEGQGTIATTGQDDAPVGKATGKVTFINQVGTAVAVPAETVIMTTDGTTTRFRTTASATVPGRVGGTADIPIEALEPGLKGNVGPLKINAIDGPLALTLRVINDHPTQGGSAERMGKVTQEDKDRLKESLTAQLTQRAGIELNSTLVAGEQVLTPTVKTQVLTATYDHFLGDASDALGLRLRVQSKALAVDMKTVDMLARKALDERVPPVARLLRDSVAVTFSSVTAQEGERITFEVVARGNIVRDLDTQSMRAAIAGKTPQEAQQILMQGWRLRQPPAIRLVSPLPEWLQAPPHSLPMLPFRIQPRVIWSS